MKGGRNLIYDTVIVGKGPAGVSAAIYLARANLRVLVIGKGYGALEGASVIENYYGFSEPIDARILHENGIKQAKRLGAEILEDEVIDISQNYEDGSFSVSTPNEKFLAKSVLLATGKARKNLKIPGFMDFLGKGISFCAICDGFFFKGKRIGVIGSGDYAAHEAQELVRFSKDITIFTNGKEAESDKFPPEVKFVKDKILKISGEDKVEKIETELNNYQIDGIFVAEGTAGAGDFALKLGIVTKDDNILVDSGYMTNIPGIFAAGDCIGGLLQIAKAVSDGANVSISIKSYLKNKNGKGK